MFMGATNAFTGDAGKGKNVLTGQTGQAIAKMARHYKSVKQINGLALGMIRYRLNRMNFVLQNAAVDRLTATLFNLLLQLADLTGQLGESCRPGLGSEFP